MNKEERNKKEAEDRERRREEEGRARIEEERMRRVKRGKDRPGGGRETRREQSSW